MQYETNSAAVKNPNHNYMDVKCEGGKAAAGSLGT